jgi:hypothetical protein
MVLLGSYAALSAVEYLGPSYGAAGEREVAAPE